MLTFIKAYIKSMRLYYAFVTGIAGWLGVAAYEAIAASANRTIEVSPATGQKVTILVMLFLSWGINQIINDYLGLKEDRINAPKRPMVTGELNPKIALSVSVILLIFNCVITWVYLQPIALIAACTGILLNVLYEYAKGHHLWGNAIFGLMIGTCTAFGFFAAGPVDPSNINRTHIAIFIMICIMNGLMTFYTYFKDYQGDKAAGKNTLVVCLGPEKSRYVALFSAVIPSFLFLMLYLGGMITVPMNNTFLFLALLTLFLELWTGVIYYRFPTGNRTYYSLAANFRACSCGQAALIALYNSSLATLLFLVTYIFVGFLFDFYTDSKV